MIIEVSFWQPENAPKPMLSSPEGSRTDFKETQSRNDSWRIFCKPSFMSMDSSFEHPANASKPIELMEDGMET